MSELKGRGAARAVADLAAGRILATVEIAVPPARVFEALMSREIVKWWGRPGVFDVHDWSGDLRVGGRWTARGNGPASMPWVLEGEFLEVSPPHRLSHTWKTPGTPGEPSVVSYVLEAVEGGTRLTLRHDGVSQRDACMGACMGWEACLAGLVRYFGGLQQ